MLCATCQSLPSMKLFSLVSSISLFHQADFACDDHRLFRRASILAVFQYTDVDGDGLADAMDETGLLDVFSPSRTQLPRDEAGLGSAPPFDSADTSLDAHFDLSALPSRVSESVHPDARAAVDPWLVASFMLAEIPIHYSETITSGLGALHRAAFMPIAICGRSSTEWIQADHDKIPASPRNICSHGFTHDDRAVVDGVAAPQQDIAHSKSHHADGRAILGYQLEFLCHVCVQMMRGLQRTFAHSSLRSLVCRGNARRFAPAGATQWTWNST